MTTFLARRLISAVALLLVVSALTFFLMDLLPDPGRGILGVSATDEQLAAKRAELGLDRPVVPRYLDWLWAALRGDLGTSWTTGLDVADSIGTKLPVTLSLTLTATVVCALFGIALGLFAAIRRGIVDRSVHVLAVAGFAIPGLWVGILLVALFAVELEWLPATGYVPFDESPVDWARSLVLPVATIAVSGIAAIAQQTRNAVATVLERDYVRTLRSRGLPLRRVLLVHVLRNATPPALTVVGLQFIGLLGGALVIEQIFALPGLGSLAIGATSQSDVPTVQGVVLVSVCVVVSVNLVVDLATGVLDPKVGMR
ncbi:ABC transporter permease [Embleya scabrispora]|uniref:ABC transporter permease n=1 Tax=Embleya scabrispora TaxID=159449 RepID=A0A1T3NNU0_9ACTN|nr:ABC transporter permease [Embleya scabrispora]OPC78402.1 ABC transporter permease [Embleya scabrispora]